MNHKITLGLIVTLLSGCYSPAAEMSPQQISMMSDMQLCQLKNSYPWEQNTEIEIGRRNLNCDPAYNECLSQGHRPNSPAMAMCIKQVRENWALQREVQKKDAQLQQQQVQQSNERMWNNILEKSRPPRQQVIQGGGSTIIQQY